MIACWLTRQFRTSPPRELRKLMETPAIPVSGMVLDLDEPDTPTLAVSRVVMRARPAGFTAGLWPTAVIVHLSPEPASAMPAAEKAGWRLTETTKESA